MFGDVFASFKTIVQRDFTCTVDAKKCKTAIITPRVKISVGICDYSHKCPWASEPCKHSLATVLRRSLEWVHFEQGAQGRDLESRPRWNYSAG